MIDVALAVGFRGIKKSFGNLAFVLPALMFPVIFFVGFAGALSGVDQLPGFDYAPGYETFQFGFVMLQSAAMAGVNGSRDARGLDPCQPADPAAASTALYGCTTLMAGSPRSTRAKLAKHAWDFLIIESRFAVAMCGVTITLSSVRIGLSGGVGSISNTSRPAA